MAINKKLISFATQAQFDLKLNAGDIDNRSIVFIEDKKRIWTHGVYFDTSWDFVTDKPGTYTPSAHTLASHSDVTLAALANGNILKYDGTNWINNTLSEAGIASTGQLNNYLPLAGGLMSGTISYRGASDIPMFERMPPYWSYNAYAIGKFTSLGGNKGLGMSSDSKGNQLIFGKWSTVATMDSTWDTIFHTGNLTNLNQLTTRNFSDLQNKPTTLSGYGITSLIFPTVGGLTPYIGNMGSDGTFGMSIEGTTYQSGLAIGGASKNLLWKGGLVYHAGNIPTWNQSTTGNAATATKVSNKLILKFDTGTTENTNLYTYDGSAAKTIDIKAGSNVSLTKAANTITISSTNTNTTYSAMSVAEGTAGTATSSRTMRADYLKQIIQHYTGAYSSRANGLGASSNSIEAKDTRSINPLPNTDLQRGVWFDFKTNSAIGLTGASTYSSVITMVPYGDSSGNSNASFRLAQSGNNLYFQNWTTVWGTWNKIWHSGNLANGTTAQYIRGDGSLATYANTTYTTGTLAQLNAGTDTTGRLQTAKLLNDWLNPKLALKADLASPAFTGKASFGVRNGAKDNIYHTRLEILPPSHTGTWNVSTKDDASKAYLSFLYGTSEVLKLAHTGEITASTFVGALSGNASSATKLASITTTFTGTYPVTFNVNGTIYSHTGITYTGSTNTLTATNFNGNASSATDADLLDGYHLVSLTGRGLYHATNGVLVETTISAATATMVYGRITGNSYGTGAPIDTTFQFYNYPTSNAIINYSALNNGYNISNIKAFNYNGLVYIHIPYLGAYQSINVELWRGQGNLKIDVTAGVSNAAMLATGVTRLVTITPLQSAFTTSNVATATALTTNAGSATQPVYFSGGKPVATTYSLGASVPSGAKFTDTVYTHPTTAGNKHIPTGGSTGQILRWSSSGTAAWGNENTGSSYTHPTTDGNKHVPATGTTNGGKVLKAGSTAGSFSWGTLGAADVGAATSGHTHSDMVKTTGAQTIAGAKTFSSSVTATAFFQVSDMRLKNVIEPLKINIKDILNIPSFYFTYKDKDKRVNIGTSAQEVQKVFPEIVSTDSKGTLSVEYDKFGLIALELIKTQQKEIDSLKYELNNLKLKIDGRNE